MNGGDFCQLLRRRRWLIASVMGYDKLVCVCVCVCVTERDKGREWKIEGRLNSCKFSFETSFIDGVFRVRASSRSSEN